MFAKNNFRDDVEDEDSDSEFDDDDDPDNVEVPGGGKDLACIALKQLNKLPIQNNICNNLQFAPRVNVSNGKESVLRGITNNGFSESNLYNVLKMNAMHQNTGLISPEFSTMATENEVSFTLQAEDDFEDDDMDVAETYSNYMPSKMKLGKQHPDQVVETSSLSSVEPNDVIYKLSIPEETIRFGALSALQLESITYASQKHEQFLPDGNRAGFFIGDGAGVGKGRTIAGIIFENFLKGREKAIWVSSSSDLKFDAERDLKDIGASNINVYALNKLKYGKISSPENGYIHKGVIFLSYFALVSESNNKSSEKYNTRLKQLLKWCHGTKFNGVLVFDECHRAKNLCPGSASKPTKTGLLVLQLQKELPNARVVYASATGASEPRNMAYMVRLGLWGTGTPFNQFTDFISAVEKQGVSAMEILAMEMKLRGLYIARQLSFHGVSFKIEKVSLSQDFIEMYNDCVKLWVEALKKFQKAADLIEAETHMKNVMWGQFWSSHQRFFKYLCIAAKVEHAVSLAKEAVKCGKCVVIGLQSTGEARTLDCLEREDGDLNDFVSTAKGVIQTLVEKHFPAPNRSRIHDLLGILPRGNSESFSLGSSIKNSKRKNLNDEFKTKKFKVQDSDDSDDYSDTLLGKSLSVNKANGTEACDPVEVAFNMKKSLLKKIEILGESLPPNALDQLIDELGGPENVAEMTGRKGRVVQDKDSFHYESRSETNISLENVNLSEKQRFMDGEKNIAIISDAASSGISLQSDRRARNQRQRVHITLELPWSAEKAVQQFGRTHRSNQVSAPEYIFLISSLAGEQRFASIVAKRLESMGALTHGDRRANEVQDFSQYNFDNRYGQTALEIVMKVIVGLAKPVVPPPPNHNGNFMKEVAEALVGVGLAYNSNVMPGKYVLDKDYNNINKFLNRILGMPVDLQNKLFQYFLDTMTAIVSQAKKRGIFDMGILDLSSGIENVIEKKRYSFMKKHTTGLAKTELHIINVERGFSWPQAYQLLTGSFEKNEGFYMNQKLQTVLLAKSVEQNPGSWNKLQYSIYKPNTGIQKRQHTIKDLKKLKKIPFEEAKDLWLRHYTASESMCSHRYVRGTCLNQDCQVGLRHRTYYVLAGSVLNLWAQVESILMMSGSRSKMQVVRLCTQNGRKIVGTLIPKNCVQTVLQTLSSQAEKSEEIEF